MISDLDILRAGQLLAERHGADAAVVTAQRADELLDSIMRAVEELQRVRPKVGEREN